MRWKRGGAIGILGCILWVGCGSTVSESDSSTTSEGTEGSSSSSTSQSGSGGSSSGNTDANGSGGASTTSANASGGANSSTGGTDASGSGGASSTGAGGSGGALSSTGAGGSGGASAQADACDVIDGRTYWSVDELECGLGPNGVVNCKWSIGFLAGVFEWSYSDVGEAGRYFCEGDVIMGVASGQRSLEGSLDRATGELIWEGEVYALQ